MCGSSQQNQTHIGDLIYHRKGTLEENSLNSISEPSVKNIVEQTTTNDVLKRLAGIEWCRINPIFIGEKGAKLQPKHRFKYGEKLW